MGSPSAAEVDPVKGRPACDAAAAVASTPLPSSPAAASRPQVIDLSNSPTLCRSAAQSSATKQRQRQRQPSGDRLASQPLATTATVLGPRGIQAEAPVGLAQEAGAAAAQPSGSQLKREQPPDPPAHEGPWFEVSGHSGRVHLHLAPDGSRPMGLSLPLEALLGVKPQGGGEERGGGMVGSDGAGGGGGGEGGRAARDQADQEAAGRRLLRQLVETYKQQGQQLTGLPATGTIQSGANGPVHKGTAGDVGPLSRHPPASGALKLSAAASGGTAAGPSTAFGWHPPAACASLAVSFIGPFGLVSLPAGLDTAWLEAAAAQGARTVGGLGMLVHQAALQLERWTGLEAPVEAMWAAVDEEATEAW